ncbi:MAG TPA: DUF1570 domain-containing protein, partial [Croceibacterium sp.]|nr:DUF1570 domain-containing protein [Croceibacterium sp.]
AIPAHAEWLEARSEHFTVVADMPEAELRSRTLKLERFDSMLRHILSPESTIPVTVYYVENMDAVQEAMGDKSGMVAGFYNVSAQRAYAVVPEKLSQRFKQEDFTPQIVLLHEYTHHMLLANASVFMPGWAQEGLAEMFATAKLDDDGSVTIGDKNDSRGSAMFGMSRWSVRRLLASDLDPPKGDEAIEAYSRGWALVHYLWMSGERQGQYVRFIEELNKGTEPIAAGEKVFGDLDALNGEINHYINRHKYNLSTFTPAQLGEIAPIAVRRLGEDDAAILRLHLASASGVDDEAATRLAQRARPIGNRYPDSVSVQEAMAEILHDAKDYDGADAAADRVLAKDPDNLMALAYKGRVAVRRALAANDKAAVAAARSWFRRAARAHQDSALPFMLYYDSFTALGETPPADAINGLYRAVVLVPQDTELRIRAALALIREGQVARARSVIAPAAFTPEAGSENKSLKLVRAMNETQDPPALLAKAAELKLDQTNDFIDPPDDEDNDD